MTALVTRAEGFLISGVGLQVLPGTSCYAAIESASSILSSVNALLGALMSAAPDNGEEIYGVWVLTQHCEALLDSVALAIREAEDPAPQNPTSQVRGAEVNQ